MRESESLLVGSLAVTMILAFITLIVLLAQPGHHLPLLVILNTLALMRLAARFYVYLNDSPSAKAARREKEITTLIVLPRFYWLPSGSCS